MLFNAGRRAKDPNIMEMTFETHLAQSEQTLMDKKYVDELQHSVTIGDESSGVSTHDLLPTTR
jgi:hypothetical protein